MSAERLHFEPGRMRYQWMTAAEHLARYGFAAPLCRGRRVLDVACGEGYGTSLLAQAGASAVVGVDVASEAIAVAEARFSAPGVRYLAGDATDLPAVLGGEAPFDLVVSYETIEHVPDVDRFLEGIRSVLAPGGIVILSAPNEPDPDGHGSANPHHRRAFSFDGFRELAERHLGKARGWFLGTPLQGMVVAEAGTPLLLNDRTDLLLMMDAQPGTHTWLLPAQRELQVGEARCAFFVGVWGADAEAAAAASPASLPGVLEPWKALEWFKSENARLLRELDAAATVTAACEPGRARADDGRRGGRPSPRGAARQGAPRDRSEAALVRRTRQALDCRARPDAAPTAQARGRRTSGATRRRRRPPSAREHAAAGRGGAARRRYRPERSLRGRAQSRGHPLARGARPGPTNRRRAGAFGGRGARAHGPAAGHRRIARVAMGAGLCAAAGTPAAWCSAPSRAEGLGS
jgi:SAM-dependent methyltransferase